MGRHFIKGCLTELMACTKWRICALTLFTTLSAAAQDDVKQELVDTGEQLITTQAQRDRNAMKLEHLADQQGTVVDGPSVSQEEDDEGEMGVLTGHLNRIAALEKEVKRLKQVCCSVFPNMHAEASSCLKCLVVCATLPI